MRDVPAGVAAHLLTPPLYARFVALFGVAARKSLLPWREVSAAEAQLLLVDHASSVQAGLAAPCLVFVGGSFPEKAPQAQWVARLPLGYTLADLIDVLDRAAVFLMDWRLQHQVGGGAAQVPAPAAVPAGDACFQLSAWVSLNAPFRSPGCVRALALLTRSPVTQRQLCEHSGLDAASAQALLAELARRGVLRTSAPAQSPAPAPALAPAQEAPWGRSQGWVLRLTRWVRGGGGVA
ncbi:MarR family transcriptional regulator [Acidovorax sp. NCPPB 2350]|nr:MarR family transcriptional regulator [Acidovorax sp. NCPPB 2350]